MRKLVVIAALLFGLAVGYLTGCRSHGQARTVTAEPSAGQHWRDAAGHARIVRAVTRDGERVTVWWHRQDGREIDRSCTLKTWKQWVRSKGAVPE